MTYDIVDISVFDDIGKTGQEVFSTSLELVTRLKALDYTNL